MSDIGRLLVGVGVLLVLIGVALMFSEKVPFLGRLPGDIHIQRGNWSFYFPIATSIVVSVLLTLLFALFSRR